MKDIFSSWKMILVFLIALFIAHLSIAQFDFRKGYIVTINADTVSGYIEYAPPQSNAYFCYFKTDLKSEKIKYNPNEIKSYAIGSNCILVSKSVVINKKYQRLFLEYLFKGVIDLYFIIDKEDNRYYFMEKDGMLYELSNMEVERIIDGKSYTVKSNDYIRTLNFLTKDSPSTNQETKEVDFTHKSLISIAKVYHDDVCDTVACIDYTRDQKKLNDAKIRIKIGFACSYNKISIENSRNTSYFGPTVSGSSDFNAEITQSNFTERFGTVDKYVYNEYAYYPGFYLNVSSNWRTTIQLEFWYKEIQISDDRFSMNSRALAFPLIIRREFWVHNKLSPFLNVGFSFNYQLSATIDELTMNYTYPAKINDIITLETFEKTAQNQEMYISRPLKTGMVYGGGISYAINRRNGFVLELRGEISSFKVSKNYNSHVHMNCGINQTNVSVILGYNYSF